MTPVSDDSRIHNNTIIVQKREAEAAKATYHRGKRKPNRAYSRAGRMQAGSLCACVKRTGAAAREIAMAGSRRLRSALAAALVRRAYTAVTAAENSAYATPYSTSATP